MCMAMVPEMLGENPSGALWHRNQFWLNTCCPRSESVWLDAFGCEVPDQCVASCLNLFTQQIGASVARLKFAKAFHRITSGPADEAGPLIITVATRDY